jgi:hypothetical protein
MILDDMISTIVEIVKFVVLGFISFLMVVVEIVRSVFHGE